MTREEFLAGMDTLKKQWSASHFGQSRVEEMWERFKNSRQGHFLATCRQLAFEGGSCPTGSRMLEAMSERKPALQGSAKQYPDCDLCDSSGFVLAEQRIHGVNQTYTKYSAAVGCSCERGRDLVTSGKVPSKHTAYLMGYNCGG